VEVSTAGTVNLILALLQGMAFPRIGTAVAIGVVGLFGYGVSLALFVRAGSAAVLESALWGWNGLRTPDLLPTRRYDLKSAEQFL